MDARSLIRVVDDVGSLLACNKNGS
ncbi:hypothetical protein CGLO_12259 [Colletotrichum gloeosporioides Cg-14]|uniref:Uncharacterized protein n=1 Tax=Colletotrichum gloeosporioides (strain Cg-14) TaxID=1237896 RepID=T0K927_COLGC|nr:hypothetical protein CGLO_12259 [Colletotrichum gloeosporioides Cg-14]